MQAVLRTAEKAAASTIPVLIEGESGVGKELIARAIHGSSDRRAQAVHRGQLRRDPREPRRIDPVRPREGRLHRRDRAAHRQVHRSDRRHAVPRRGRRTAAGGAGEAAARHPGGRGRAGRRAQAGQGRRAARLGHQPQSDRRREERALPRGPVLSPARVPDLGAAAARARRGHSRPDAPFPRALRGRGRQAHPRGQRRGADAAGEPSLAGQRAPARECRVPRRGAGRGRHHRRRRVPAGRGAGRRPIGHHRAGRRAAGDRRSAAATSTSVRPRRPACRPAPRRARWACSTPTATSARSRRSRPTPSASPSPIIAGRCPRSRAG